MKTENINRQSMLFEVLSTFSKKEYVEFGKLVRSPLYIAGRNLYPLYLLLGKYHPDFESRRAKENLTKENIFEKLYPGTVYNEKRSGTILRRLFSDLNKQAEEYLLLRAVRNNFLKSEYLLTEELISRNLDANYKKHIRKIEEHLKTNKIDEYYFRYMADAENLKYKYNLLRRDHPELVTDNVIRKGKYNISNSLLMLAEAMHDLGVNHRTYNSPYKETMIYQFAEKIDYRRLIDYASNSAESGMEVVETCCYELLNILNPGNRDLIFKYKGIVEKNLHMYSKEMQKDMLEGIYSMMINARLGKESFELVRFILERGLFHIDKTKPFPLIIYKNLVRGALRNNEYKWAEKFIETYHKELSTEYREDMLHYGRAFLKWETGDHAASLEESSRVSLQNTGLVMDMKILTLMVYYETEAFEPALSLIDSLKLFLKQNKKISPEYDLYFSGFVKMTKRLLRCRMGEGRETAAEIAHELNSAKDIYAIEWLREKANELFNKRMT